MLEISNTEVFGFEHAIRGMRNPMNSWDKSDSYWTHVESAHTGEEVRSQFIVGDADKDLMMRLARGGSDDAKYRRMIVVYLDILAPLYWWKEFDTYKVGTVANSCSTMHKIHAKEFTLEDFSCEHLYQSEELELMEEVIGMLNDDRELYLDGKKKNDWWQMIQLLPSSYNQKRTVMLNYEVLHNIYHARKNHKLDEWHVFCDWVERLPHSDVITGEEGFDDLKGTVGERVKNSVEAYERVSEEFPSLLERNDI